MANRKRLLGTMMGASVGRHQAAERLRSPARIDFDESFHHAIERLRVTARVDAEVASGLTTTIVSTFATPILTAQLGLRPRIPILIREHIESWAGQVSLTYWMRERGIIT